MYERDKRPEFLDSPKLDRECQSCHKIPPRVDSLEQKTLASVPLVPTLLAFPIGLFSPNGSLETDILATPHL